MKFTNEIVVAAGRERVWELFQDVHAVVPCLPGAEVTGQDPDGTVHGLMKSKLGPLSLTFAGKATLTYDESASTVTIDGSGVDKRGGSRAKVTVVARLHPQGDSTRVTLDSDLTLSGKAAQFGRTGLIEEVAGRMLQEFASCLGSKMAAGTAEQAAAITAAPPNSMRLLMASLVAWARKKFARRAQGNRRQESQSAA